MMRLREISILARILVIIAIKVMKIETIILRK